MYTGVLFCRLSVWLSVVLSYLPFKNRLHLLKHLKYEEYYFNGTSVIHS